MTTAEITPEAQPIAGDFTGKNILSINQFTPADVEILFEQADLARQMLETPRRRERNDDILDGAMIDLFFYENSTRTVLSFEKAAKKLGADTTKTTGVQFSSVSKGENLQDTMQTLESTYADAIVLRHNKLGSAAVAAKHTEVPVINGGDGEGEHPTQALLDLYTIISERKQIEGLTVTMLGDLKYGRTVHSLSRLLGMYDVKLNYVSPEQLSMPEEIVAELDGKGISQTQTQDLEEVLGDTDILYATRIQEERFEGPAPEEDYEAVKDQFVITPRTMAHASPDMRLLHPLPRINEIEHRVDHDPRAAYFRQVSSGVAVRMGLLALVLGERIPGRPIIDKYAAASQAI